MRVVKCAYCSTFVRVSTPTYCHCAAIAACCWLQESTDELYLIPAIDMLNHSTDPALRNTSLALFHGDVEVTLGDGTTRHFTNFFSMEAGASCSAYLAYST